MNRIILLSLALVFASSAASAKLGVNGESLNGMSLNRLAANGVSLNGTSFNKLAANGANLNGGAGDAAAAVVQAVTLADGTHLTVVSAR